MAAASDLTFVSNPFPGSEACTLDDLVALTPEKRKLVTLPTHIHSLRTDMHTVQTKCRFPPRPISEPLPFIFASETEAWVVAGTVSGNFFARRFRSTRAGRHPELVEIGNFSGVDIYFGFQLHGEGCRVEEGVWSIGNFEHGNFIGKSLEQPRVRRPLLVPDPRINFRSDEISLDAEAFAHGAFGRVFRGNFKKFPITPTSSASTAPGNSQQHSLAVKKFENPEEMGKEISVLKFLAHCPNVVRLKGVVFEPGNFWLLTGLVSRSLCTEIYSESLTNLNTLEILRDVATALVYMHDRHLGHFDLKSPNVLLEISSSGRAKAVLCDFGHVALAGISDHKKPRVGTFAWAAPEMLRVDEPRASVQADVWSFGVLAWEISVCRQPWRGVKSALVIAAVGYGGCSPGNFEGISIAENSDLKKLVDSCFVFAPERRPCMRSLLDDVGTLISRMRKHVDTEISSFLCGG